ncbi:MAG: hypothetical protein M3303_00945 [Gemmatimonadota bacterium]|nr:hypothetical protein [Gemmatimonadota bacterium]
MLRTVLTIGIFAMLGLFALKLVFGILPLLLGIVWSFFVLAVQIAVFGAIVYFIIRIVSPDTARRLRSRWSGSTS